MAAMDPADGENLAAFVGAPLDEAARVYLRLHRRRFEYLLREIEAILTDRHGGAPRILDIGPSFQTAALRARFPDATVNALGFEDWTKSARPHDRCVIFDLNDARDPRKWPAIEQHDLIVFAEVIEHLYTSPVQVLRCVASWLKPDGVLLLQTPNPISLGRRLSHLAGRNPFEIIRETPTNPGHFCEYTVSELQALAGRAELRVERFTVSNYLGREGVRAAAYNAVCAVLPANFRDGITMWLRKRKR